MNVKTKLLVFFFFTWHNTCSLEPMPTSKYDITEPLQKSIISLFRNVEKYSTSTFFIRNMGSRNHSVDYRLKNGMILKEFDSATLGSLDRRIYRNFSNNGMRITIDQLFTEVQMTIKLNNSIDSAFLVTIIFNNVSINLTKSSKNLNGNYSFDISYLTEITRFNMYDDDFKNWTEPCESQKREIKLFQQSLQSVLSNLVMESVKNNDNFRTALISTFCQDPKKDIISKIPNFPMFEQLYHYFIAKTQFSFFNLTNIFIHGLSNYVSFKSIDQCGDVHTLETKNIRGRLSLDYKAANETSAKSLPLYFQTDSILISINQKENRINVEAGNYRVVRSENGIKLSHDLSAMVMHHIESAIATSFLPFMKNLCYYPFYTATIWWSDDQRSRVYVREDQVRKLFDHTSNKKRPYDYAISFHNITVKLVSGYPRPEEIHCQFPKNLNITRRINAKPMGKLRFDNDDETIDINFNVNFTSIRFSLINAKDSKANETCEFQINPNREAELGFEPLKSSELTTDEMNLKDKIDRAMISAVKEQNTSGIREPANCSLFNLCTSPVKVLDNFIRNFINNVLEKCSLRRNSTT